MGAFPSEGAKSITCSLCLEPPEDVHFLPGLGDASWLTQVICLYIYLVQSSVAEGLEEQAQLLVCDTSGPCWVVIETYLLCHRVCLDLVLGCTLAYNYWNLSTLSFLRFIFVLVPLWLFLGRVLEYMHLWELFADHGWLVIQTIRIHGLPEW